MKKENRFENNNYETFGKNFKELFEELKKKDIDLISTYSGAVLLNKSVLQLDFFEKKALVDFENRDVIFSEGKNPWESEKEKLFVSSIILHYLNQADGTALSGEWISYRDLPGGMFYALTIPGVLRPLCNKFSSSGKEFISRIENLGGKKRRDYKFGAILYPFVRLPLLFIFEEKDKEFDAELLVCMDSNASHYMKTDIIKTLLVFIVKRLISI